MRLEIITQEVRITGIEHGQCYLRAECSEQTVYEIYATILQNLPTEKLLDYWDKETLQEYLQSKKESV